MKRNILASAAFILSLGFVPSWCRPQPQSSSFVTTAPTNRPKNVGDYEEDYYDEESKPEMSSFLVTSEIKFRYARTVVETKFKNINDDPSDVEFSFDIPESALISNFSMIIGGVEYVAKVQAKEEAQETFGNAVNEGRGAGLVERGEANRIAMSVNVEGQAKITFRLTYEEQLTRVNNKYVHKINVNPGQIVKNFRMDVKIRENVKVDAPSVPDVGKSANEIVPTNSENPYAVVEPVDGEPGFWDITFKLSKEQQQELIDGRKEGIEEQFIVEYDVELKDEGEIQVIDGYFVHYFTSEKEKILPKHVVFVLDLSGSMYGEKLTQTKDAMVTILDDLTAEDRFNILTFSDNVESWAPEAEKQKEGEHQVTYQGTEDMRLEALRYVLTRNTLGGTNINDALLRAIELVEEVKKADVLLPNTKPIIIFLTDGEATTGETSPRVIRENTKDANKNVEVGIYGLAFGSGADFGLIKSISQDNDGLARKVYEGSDATIQLENFYFEIGSPTLTDVKFEYVGEAIKNDSITDTTLNTLNKGGEMAVAGAIDTSKLGEDGKIDVLMSGQGKDGPYVRRICFIPRPLPIRDDVLRTEEDKMATSPILPIDPECIPIDVPKEPKGEGQNFIERLWAHKTITQLLSKKKTKSAELKEEILSGISTTTTTTISPPEDATATNLIKRRPPIAEPKTPKDKALELALKYNFVTPITSLVVVRPSPNSTLEEPRVSENVIDPEPVSASQSSSSSYASSGFLPMRRVAMSSGSSGSFSRSGAPAPQVNRCRTCYMANIPPQSSSNKRVTSRVRTPVVGPRGPPAPSPAYYSDYDAMMESDDTSYYDQGLPGRTTTTRTTTTTTMKTTCSGSLSLHSKVLRRGTNVTLTDDIEDLASRQFDNKLTSLEVRGDCCWEIYTEPDFQGTMQLIRFGMGEVNPDKLIDVFRRASSVKKLFDC